MASVAAIGGDWNQTSGKSACSDGVGLVKGWKLLNLTIQKTDGSAEHCEFHFIGRGQSRDVYKGCLRELGDCVLKLQYAKWEQAMLHTVTVAQAPQMEGMITMQHWHGTVSFGATSYVAVLEEAAPNDCAQMVLKIVASNMTLARKVAAMKAMWMATVRLFFELTRRGVKVDDVGPRNLACTVSSPYLLPDAPGLFVKVLDWEALDAGKKPERKLLLKALDTMVAHSVPLLGSELHVAMDDHCSIISGWWTSRFYHNKVHSAEMLMKFVTDVDAFVGEFATVFDGPRVPAAMAAVCPTTPPDEEVIPVLRRHTAIKSQPTPSFKAPAPRWAASSPSTPCTPDSDPDADWGSAPSSPSALAPAEPAGPPPPPAAPPPPVGPPPPAAGPPPPAVSPPPRHPLTSSKTAPPAVSPPPRHPAASSKAPVPKAASTAPPTVPPTDTKPAPTKAPPTAQMAKVGPAPTVPPTAKKAKAAPPKATWPSPCAALEDLVAQQRAGPWRGTELAGGHGVTLDQRLQTGALYPGMQRDWEPQRKMDLVVALLTCAHVALQPYVQRVCRDLDNYEAVSKSGRTDGRRKFIQAASPWGMNIYKAWVGQESDLWVAGEWNRLQCSWAFIEMGRHVMGKMIWEFGKGESGRFRWKNLVMDTGEMSNCLSFALAGLSQMITQRRRRYNSSGPYDRRDVDSDDY
jgi:hypothetical protein